MPTRRRVIAILNSDDTSPNWRKRYVVRTVRIDNNLRNPVRIVEAFIALLRKFAAKYQTLAKFVEPLANQDIEGYYPKQDWEDWTLWYGPEEEEPPMPPGGIIDDLRVDAIRRLRRSYLYRCKKYRIAPMSVETFSESIRELINSGIEPFDAMLELGGFPR